MATRWSGLYSFHWAPILTFESRRQRALEWLESNVAVRAYLDRQAEFGVAADPLGLRIVVKKNGFDLLLGAPDITSQDAHGLITGVLHAFPTRAFRVSGARTLWSSPLQGAHEELAAELATSLVDLPSGFRMGDFSILSDGTSPSGTVTIEYGVVDDAELRTRLTRVDMGRMKAAEMPPVQQIPNHLPSTASFVDVNWVTLYPDLYSGSEDDTDGMLAFVDSRVALVEDEARQLVEGVSSRLNIRERNGEFGRGA